MQVRLSFPFNRPGDIRENPALAGPLKLLCSYGADVGISDARLHLYQADGATWQGPAADATEATRVAWIPFSEIRELLDRGHVDDGASITALLYLLAFPPSGTAMA